jgi:transcriptional antiterminator
MQHLEEKPRNINTIAKYLNVSSRTVYRYLKLYEALGYEVKKDMFNKVKIEKI